MYLIYVDLIVYIIAKKLFKEQIFKGIDINKHNDKDETFQYSTYFLKTR